MIPQIVVLALVQLAGMISPGPTAMLMVRSSAGGGRVLGYWMALGITAASAVHVAASAAGLAELVVRNESWSNAIRVAGSLYLGYLGGKLLLSRFRVTDGGVEGARPSRADGATAVSFRQGFVTNLLNPKVTLLYLALFGQLSASSSRQAIYVLGALFVAQSLTYWTLFAKLIGSDWFRRRWSRCSGPIELAFGVALVGFGVRLLLDF